MNEPNYYTGTILQRPADESSQLGAFYTWCGWLQPRWWGLKTEKLVRWKWSRFPNSTTQQNKSQYSIPETFNLTFLYFIFRRQFLNVLPLTREGWRTSQFSSLSLSSTSVGWDGGTLARRDQDHHCAIQIKEGEQLQHGGGWVEIIRFYFIGEISCCWMKIMRINIHYTCQQVVNTFITE